MKFSITTKLVVPAEVKSSFSKKPRENYTQFNLLIIQDSDEQYLAKINGKDEQFNLNRTFIEAKDSIFNIGQSSNIPDRSRGIYEFQEEATKYLDTYTKKMTTKPGNVPKRFKKETEAKRVYFKFIEGEIIYLTKEDVMEILK